MDFEKLKFCIIVFLYFSLIISLFLVGIIYNIHALIGISIILFLILFCLNFLGYLLYFTAEKEKNNLIKQFLKKNNFKGVIEGDNRCSICLENIDKKNMFCFKECKHSFHIECIKKWINYNKNCPICRKEYP
tara:strand:- start:1941 stop:2336 length:396 start_codon:yes stop_codon:yes gene_type:complete